VELSARSSSGPAFLGSALATDPNRPLLTYYDDATGERTELSAATLGNWVVKTANLLGECGLGPGDRAAVLLPPHWQTAAVLLGTWTAGLGVDLHLAATAGLPGLGTPAAGPPGVVFAAVDRVEDLTEEVPQAAYRFALGLAPLGAPMRTVPEGYEDYVAEVRGQADELESYAPTSRTDPAIDATTYQEWGAVAREVAASIGIGAGDRVLIDAARSEHPVNWLLAPLSVGATMVLCANLDRDVVTARAKSERITRVLAGE
jgi:uncharacterized protein (TIGR03089 family)